jgi:probable rRNA maturation factor
LPSKRFSTSRLSLRISADVGKQYVPYLRRQLRAAHASLRSKVRELSAALVSDAQMSDLHKRFMGVGGPTDVLSFALDEDDRGRVIAGELIICVPEARRQARRMRTTIEREILLYALHGLLHLSGLDDRTPAGFAEMHRREDEILSKLGIGPVFAPRADRRDNRRNGER